MRFIVPALALLCAFAADARAEDVPSLPELRARTRALLEEPDAPRRKDAAHYLAAADELYRRGDYPQAEDHIKQLLPRHRRDPAVMDLYLRVLLARGRSQQAADWILSQQNPGAQTPYTRFNLAVALARSGRGREAVTILHRLGTGPAADAEARALRDQANLALGWYFLARNLGDNARAAFRRVQLRGPQANRALLGMGWGELAPQDARAYRELVGDEASAFDARQFAPELAGDPAARRAPATDLRYLTEPAGLPDYGEGTLSAAEQLALRRALRAWSELRDRDRNDPFVWESWIAMPYALEKAGLHEQAIAHYREAIARMDSLEAAMKLEAGRADAFGRQALETAGAVSSATKGEAPWMGAWLAGNSAQVVLEDVAESRRNQSRLADAGMSDARDRGEAVALQQSWRVYEEDRAREFARLLSAQVTLRRQLLRRYRQTAHIALARLLDPPAVTQRTQPDTDPPMPRSFWERLNLFGKDRSE